MFTSHQGLDELSTGSVLRVRSKSLFWNILPITPFYARTWTLPRGSTNHKLFRINTLAKSIRKKFEGIELGYGLGAVITALLVVCSAAWLSMVCNAIAAQGHIINLPSNVWLGGEHDLPFHELCSKERDSLVLTFSSHFPSPTRQFALGPRGAFCEEFRHDARVGTIGSDRGGIVGRHNPIVCPNDFVLRDGIGKINNELIWRPIAPGTDEYCCEQPPQFVPQTSAVPTL